MSEFLGSRISLISRSDIRYVGILHSINSDDSTVSLENVRSFGTEDRKSNADEFVPPSEQLYEYIVFRGTDVKDLRIEEGPAPVKEAKPPAVPNDPAILGARPRPGNVIPGPPGPPGPPGQLGPHGPQGPHVPLSHPGPQNQQGPPPGAPGFGYYPPHMGGWGRAGGPGPAPFGGMPYPPQPWFGPGQEIPPMGHGPWNPYPFQPGPGGPPGPPGIPGGPAAPGAPGQGRQSANQTPNNQAATQKPAPIGPSADKKPLTPSQQPGFAPEPKAANQAPKQPAAAPAPPPPVESKPTVEEVKATAASLAGNAPAPAAREPSKTIPTGPKSSRPAQILPAVPLPAALTAKAAQVSQPAPKPVPDQNSAAAAAAALRDATQAAKEAVAVAMARLDNSATLQQVSEANGVDNLTKKVEEMRINAARGTATATATGQTANNRTAGGRGGPRTGPRPAAAKVEVPDADFDFASANAKFNKHDVVKEAIAGSPLTEAPPGEEETPESAADAPAPVEAAYNKSRSFFDNISSEMKDRESAAGQKLGGREWRGEETRKNIETFGQGSVDGGYHRGYHRGGRGRGRGGRGRGFRGGRGAGAGAGAGGGHGGFRSREAQPAAQ